jgi:UDP-glucose 4-epimerase
VNKTILVTGGAGYIGSHIVLDLLNNGYNPVTLDNLSTGHRKSIRGGEFYSIDLANKDDLKAIFKKHSIDTVIHLSGSCYVGESVVNPHKYHVNNISNSLNLLEAMIENNVKQIIFSSSAAVYGQPKYVPIDENHPKEPCNPYGLSKLVLEKIIDSYELAYGLKHIHLRYFNAAGADPNGSIGEDHYPETHIIPLLVQAALGKKKRFTVFGSDYDTKDGTCIRDYIHVSDLATAHIKAMEFLNNEKTSNDFNVGTSVGHSVKDIINKVTEIVGKDIPVDYAERREGDPSILIASANKAKNILRWEAKYNLDDIIRTACNWHKNHASGYSDGQ